MDCTCWYCNVSDYFETFRDIEHFFKLVNSKDISMDPFHWQTVNWSVLLPRTARRPLPNFSKGGTMCLCAIQIKTVWKSYFPQRNWKCWVLYHWMDICTQKDEQTRWTYWQNPIWHKPLNHPALLLIRGACQSTLFTRFICPTSRLNDSQLLSSSVSSSLCQDTRNKSDFILALFESHLIPCWEHNQTHSILLVS